METKWFKTNEMNAVEYEKSIALAKKLLVKGELVAFPTETVYGLGANAFEAAAAEKIYEVKGRPSDNPLIVHIANIGMLEEVVAAIPPVCRRLAFTFWPGPLTLILPKNAKIPKAITGGLDTVAVRMPGHGVALDLLDALDFPLAAPSANLSGKPSPTRGQHVFQDLGGRIPLLLDSGEVEIGLESTILDLTLVEPVILRPGKITYEDLKPFVPRLKKPCRKIADKASRPKAPGMKYRHYAPCADVYLFPKGDRGAAFLAACNWQEPSCVIASASLLERLGSTIAPIRQYAFADEAHHEDIAHELFHIFRSCDLAGITAIYMEELKADGLGEALMNRIEKAAQKE